MKFQPHPYHLVEPSPWPLAISIALLTTTVSAVCLFHGYAHAGVFTIIGLLAVISAMGIWWADVIREGKVLSLFFCGISHYDSMQNCSAFFKLDFMLETPKA
jgi:hypothetical protein